MPLDIKAPKSPKTRRSGKAKRGPVTDAPPVFLVAVSASPATHFMTNRDCRWEDTRRLSIGSKETIFIETMFTAV